MVEDANHVDKTFVEGDPKEIEDTTIVNFVDEDPTPLEGEDKSQPIGYLIIKNGSYRGRVFQLVENTTVGRKEGNIIIRDPQMSRRHALISRVQDSFFVEDLNTINGTFLNGVAVNEKQSLKPDDVVLIGETEFEFKYLG